MFNKLFTNKYRSEMLLSIVVLLFMVISCSLLYMRSINNGSFQRYESDIELAQITNKQTLIVKNWNKDLCNNFKQILSEKDCSGSILDKFSKPKIGDTNTAINILFNMERQFLSNYKIIQYVKNYTANIKAESSIIKTEVEEQKSFKNLWGFTNIISNNKQKNIKQSLIEKTSHQQRIEEYTQNINLKQITATFNTLKQKFSKSESLEDKVLVLSDINAFLQGQKGEGASGIKFVLDSQKNQPRSMFTINLIKFGSFIWIVWVGFLLFSLYIIRSNSNIFSSFFGITLAFVISNFLIKLLLGQGLSFLSMATFIMGSLIITTICHWRIKKPSLSLSSGLFIPGILLFVGLNWLLIADISLNFNNSRRFLILESFNSIYWAFAILVYSTLCMQFFLYFGNKVLSILFSPIKNPYKYQAILSGIAIIMLVFILSKFSSHIQSKSGEILKVIVLFFFAWFLMIRGNFLLLNRIQDNKLVLNRLNIVFGFLIFCLIYALVTKDFGPLLLTFICAVFWVVPITFSSRKFLSIQVSIALIFALFFIIILLGKLNLAPNVIVERVNILLNPFSAVNDDVARLLWFQQESPLTGFGIGYAPWCGYADEIRCIRGLPLQLQSDYTFTALIGIYGIFAIFIVLAMILWVWRIIHNYYQYPIETMNLLASKYERYKALQICLAMCFGTLLIVQLCVSVSGNLAWVPLTGITMPYISFGTTAIMAYSFISGLIIHKIR